MEKFIVPMGIITFILLIMTFATGVLFYKFHLRWASVRIHIVFAVLTVLAAFLHTILVVLSH